RRGDAEPRPPAQGDAPAAGTREGRETRPPAGAGLTSNRAPPALPTDSVPPSPHPAPDASELRSTRARICRGTAGDLRNGGGPIGVDANSAPRGSGVPRARGGWLHRPGGLGDPRGGEREEPARDA